MVIGDLAFTNHHVMRKHAAHGFMETAANGFFRHLEVAPRSGPAGVQFLKGLFHEMKCGAGGVNLEVGSSPVALNGVAPLGNLSFEFDFRQGSGVGEIHLHAVACRLDVADIDQAGERR